MANTQIIDVREDGAINCVVDVIFQLPASGGSEVAYEVIIDPANLGYIDPDNTYKANELRPVRIIGNCSDGITVSLFFDAPSPLLFQTFDGRLDINYRPRMGSLENKAVMRTGAIGISTTGYSSGTASYFTLTLEMLKIRRGLQGGTSAPFLAFNTPAASQYIGLFGRA